MLNKPNFRRKNKELLLKLSLLLSSMLIFFLVMELIVYLPLFDNHFDRDVNDTYYPKDGEMVFFSEQRVIDFENITDAYLLTLSHTCGNTNYKTCNIRICESPEFRDKGSFRVVFIGDSVTYGMNQGTDNPDKIFTSILSKKLKNKSSKNIKFEVFNYAVPGFNLNDIAFFYNFASKCIPDLVIYGYSQNDRSYYSSYTIATLPYLKFKYSDRWYHKSRTLLFFKESFWSIIDHCQSSYPLKCPIKSLNYQEAENILDKIRYKNNNTKFHIINIPFIEETYPTDDFVETYSKKKEIDYLDIRKEFLKKDLDPLSLRAIPYGVQHYNYRGHNIIANKLYKDLLEKGLIPNNNNT